VEQIGDGLNAGAREYDAYVIGGDTGEASDLIISVSLFGLATKKQLTLRSGAKPGDLVAVTGPFGKPPAGLKILKDGLTASAKVRRVLVDSVLMPHARLKEGLALSLTGAVSSAIDSSDGLAWSLHEIAKASDVGFLIERVPFADEVRKFAEDNKLDAVKLALYGGEEYELVLTVKPELQRIAEEAVAKVGGRLLWIGKIIARKRLILDVRGRKLAIERRGYEHFVDA
jgi:thiamine-monophosphate kinase